MHTISAVIIDDEQNNIDNLFHLLASHCPEVAVIATATNVDEGIKVIRQYGPELVFLDIQMSDKTGFDLLKAFTHYNFEVIFITAYDQYGIQAIKFSAIDYLLKPVNTGELKEAVQKVFLKTREKKQNRQLENLLSLLQQNQQRQEHRIALPTSGETRFVKTEQIVRCESSNAYTTFYFSDGEKLLVSKPIFEYDELLNDYGFIRCHQSHLVNKRYIKSWKKEDGGYLLLYDLTQVPVSRQKKEQVLNAITKLS
ncbi:MAG TPA: LytTR family DNA-binding domain-containing protein [Flavisolibacter sp.]|nr:LytTR family DNA-binding domain-containing protein [Flavisolibacter sp.]